MKTATIRTSDREPTPRNARYFSAEDEIALKKDELYSWKGNNVGLVIEAREGAVWLTQMGDRSDIILSRGECFRVTNPGPVVAQSLAAVARLFTHSRH